MPVSAKIADVAGLAAIALCLIGTVPAKAQTSGLGAAIELVDPDVLRVCADPANLPFSNDKGEGFENELAEFVAETLGKSVAYTWFPQAMGFVRMTLAANECDVIMGYPQGDELVQNTNPYYRTSYAMVIRDGTGLDDIATLGDPRLKEKRIGVIAGTPPATDLARKGLMGNVEPYRLMVDTRRESPAQDMIADLEAGRIDLAVLWGPIAGYFAAQSDTDQTVVPLTGVEGGSRMTYRITMGVRPSDQEWKRELNALIADHQTEIDAILRKYHVPLLDEQNRPILP